MSTVKSLGRGKSDHMETRGLNWCEELSGWGGVGWGGIYGYSRGPFPHYCGRSGEVSCLIVLWRLGVYDGRGSNLEALGLRFQGLGFRL